MKTEIVKAAKSGIFQLGFALKKHSPTVLLVGGVIGVGCGTVMACTATTKASQIIDTAKEQLDQIHEVSENPDMKEQYSDNDRKKDLAIVYFQTGKKFVKLYGPATVVMALSLASIITSNRIMTKRNLALAAANTAVTTGFNAYRGRVVERFGKKVDDELIHNTHEEKIEEEVVDDDGKVKKIKAKSLVVGDDISAFTRIIDRSCGFWDEDIQVMSHSLRNVENYINNVINSRATNHKEGVYLMNEALREMRFHDADGNVEQTKIGMTMGWKGDKNSAPFSLNCWDENGRLKLAKRLNSDGEYENVVLVDMSANITDIYNSGLILEK